MRTIKRISNIINLTKWRAVSSIAHAYAKEKNYWLSVFQRKNFLEYTKNHHKMRDAAVAKKYQSPNSLQARMWKLALIDAAETMDKYWQSIYEKIKADIYRQRNFDKNTRYYCFWLLKDYRKLLSILNGECIEFNELNDKQIKHATHFLKRKLKNYRKAYPRVKINRSFALDENCYTCFEHNGK